MKSAKLLCALCALLLLNACGSPSNGGAEASPEHGPAEAGTQLSKGAEGTLPEEVHEPAAEPQTVEDPVSGYCGNTVTEVVLNGGTYAFWGDDSVALTDIVINLPYADGVCRCLPEFTVNTEFGDGYGVNLTEHYVRLGDHQSPITEEQAETIRGILNRNCTEENLVGDD